MTAENVLRAVARCPIVTQTPHPIDEVPRTPIRGLGLSFHDIATELDGFIDELLSYPQTQAFLANPYDLNGDNTERVEEVDRLWARLGNRFVNNHRALPSPQWNRKITFITNGGLVFINCQTFIPGTPTNYSIMFTKSEVNPVDASTVADPNRYLAIPSTTFYNPEKTDFSSMFTDATSQLTGLVNIQMGSTTPPNTDPSDLTPESSTATSFQILQLNTSRKEIFQALMTGNYGWTSRYAETDFYANFYVARVLAGADGYEIVIRLSYYFVPL